MPFLTQGKTNWKYIIVVVVLAAVVGGITLSCQYWFPKFIQLPISKKSTCTQDAASNFLWSGQGTDPCNRSCEFDNDCKFECGCDCISKNEKCIYTGIECEMPDPDYGCKCIDNTCKYEYIGIDETADWKTYRNEKYGFEIKYPENWNMDLDKAPYHIRFDVNGDNHLTKEEYKAGGGIYYDQRYVDDIKIETFPSLTALPRNEKGLTLQEWINERKKAYLVGYQKEVQIGEYEGVEIQDLGLVTSRSIFLIHNDIIYNFEIIENHSEISVFNQMLSTFEFLD